MGVQDDLAAASGSGFALGGLEKCSAVALASQILADPEIAYLAAAAPGPAVDAGGYVALRVAHEEGEEAGVADAGLVQVVIDDAVLEELDVLGGGVCFQGGVVGFHC